MNALKKVLLVANSTWNFYNFRQNIIDALLEKNYEVILISPVDEYLNPLLNAKPIRHIRLRQLERMGTNPYRDIRLFFELLNIYKTEQPDLIIHYTIKPNIYGNLAARICKIKSICVVTGLGYVFLHHSFFNSVAKRLIRTSFKSSSMVVFENEDDQQLFIEQQLVTRKQTALVNGCGINLEYFKPIKTPKDDNNKIIFSFIARLIKDKGITEYVDAARRIQLLNENVEFWVAGELDKNNPTCIAEDQLMEWIQSGVIKYFGALKDVRPLISKSDCIVLPSYREAMARTLTESLAMEIPVITANSSGCNFVVDEGQNGFLVPPKDAMALSEAIEKFLSLDQTERSKMGKRGREKMIELFDEKIVTNQFLQIINMV